jgi:hypothetical protein
MRLEVLRLDERANPTTYTWVGGGSGYWETNANWSPAGLPAETDTAIFPAGSTTSVMTLSSREIGVLNVDAAWGGTFNLGGDLTVDGTGTGSIASGTFSGAKVKVNGPVSTGGTTLDGGGEILAGGTMTIDESATTQAKGFKVDAGGTLNFIKTDAILRLMDAGHAYENAGTIYASRDGSINRPFSGGPDPTFANTTGTIEKVNVSGEAATKFTIAVPFVNYGGTVNVRAGTLSMTSVTGPVNNWNFNLYTGATAECFGTFDNATGTFTVKKDPVIGGLLPATLSGSMLVERNGILKLESGQDDQHRMAGLDVSGDLTVNTGFVRMNGDWYLQNPGNQAVAVYNHLSVGRDLNLNTNSDLEVDVPNTSGNIPAGQLMNLISWGHARNGDFYAKHLYAPLGLSFDVVGNSYIVKK